MGSSLAHLNWRLLLAVAVAAGVSPAAAQRMPRSGQPILLSAPEADMSLTNAPSLAPKPPSLPDFSDTIRAPDFDFNAPANIAPLPPPVQRALSSAEAAQLQALRDKDRNWPMMTPEEIMGIPTPEKIIGLSERDAGGKPQKKSAVEGYYERQAQRQHSRTNASPAGAFRQEPGFFDHQDLQWNAKNLNAPTGDHGTLAAMRLFASSAPANDGAPRKNPTTGWLQSPALQTSVSTANQEANMDEFRKMLEPHSPPSTSARNAASDKISAAPLTVPDSIFGKFPANFIGTPPSPAVAGIGVPTRVAPLPGLLGQTNAPPLTPPDWKPELPPWMSTTPRPGEIPQRKF